MFQSEIFGDRLHLLRNERGMSQQALGELIGVGKTQISEMENGHATTTFSNLVILADYFEVTADYLLGRTDQRN